MAPLSRAEKQETIQRVKRLLKDFLREYMQFMEMATQNRWTPSGTRVEATKVLKIYEQVSREMDKARFNNIMREEFCENEDSMHQAMSIFDSVGAKPMILTRRSIAMNEMGDYEDAKSGMDVALDIFEKEGKILDKNGLVIKALALDIKGRSCSMMGEYDAGFKCLLEACAIQRRCGDGAVDVQLFADLLEIIGKMNIGKVRPHFKEEARIMICRKLRINEFSKRRWKCFQCSSAGLSLKVCGRCKVAWYCSVDCQRMNWKRSHKIECDQLKMEKMGL